MSPRDSLRTVLAGNPSQADHATALLAMCQQFQNVDWDSVAYYGHLAKVAAAAAGMVKHEAQAVTEILSAYSYIGKPEAILELKDESMELVQRANDTLLSIKVLNLIAAYGHHPLGQIVPSIPLYQQALGLTEKKEKYLRAYQIVGVNLYNAYVALDQLDEGLAIQQAMLELAQQYNNQGGTRRALIMVGNSYVRIGEYPQAKTYYDRAAHMFEAGSDSTGYETVLDALGQWHIVNETYDSAIWYLEQLLDFYHRKDNTYDVTLAKQLLGKAYVKAGKNLTLATNLLTEAYEQAKALQDKHGMIRVTKDLIKAYEKTSQFQAGFELAYSTLEEAEAMGYVRETYNLHQRLAELHEANGTHEEAFKHLKLSYAINDSLEMSRTRAKEKQLIARYHLKEKEIENQRLQFEQHRNENIIKQRSMMALIAILGLLFSMAIGTLLYYRNQERRRYSEKLEQDVKQRTAELELTNQRLIRSNEELERFAYITSHDLKEPIRNILSFATILEKRMTNLSEDELSYLDYIQFNAKQMYSLVEDVLAFSMMRREDIGFELMALGPMLEDVVRTLEGLRQQKGGSISVGALPVLSANSTQLRMLFKNLIENGLKYNEDPHPEVTVSYVEEKNQYVFAVRDNGIGIDPAYHDQLFQLFTRLHSRDKFQGSGVGLAICQLIVDTHGGEIWVESKVGKGATFFFSIPKPKQEL